VSNTLPVSQETVAEGVTKTTFATTAPLPTYLVAIAVGPYEIATGPVIPPSRLRTAPLPVRAVTVMGKSDASRYALMETPPLVRALEDYFAAPFPYPKLDLITPPNFLAGGMENAGAITYTERGILLGPRPSVSQQRYFKLLHAHEVAHQWFGDLVTPRWWNDIWLNEAFASWIGNKISAETWPRDQFSRETTRDALDIMDHDSLSTARAIRQPIVTNDDIFNAFDGLTYDKGAAVLQMFENFLGSATFREGVRLHMRKFAHGTADTDDFIRSLAEASKKPEVAQAIETFLNQPGLPLGQRRNHLQRQGSRRHPEAVSLRRLLEVRQQGLVRPRLHARTRKRQALALHDAWRKQPEVHSPQAVRRRADAQRIGNGLLPVLNAIVGLVTPGNFVQVAERSRAACNAALHARRIQGRQHRRQHLRGRTAQWRNTRRVGCHRTRNRVP
jgi:hypothetical protein